MPPLFSQRSPYPFPRQRPARGPAHLRNFPLPRQPAPPQQRPTQQPQRPMQQQQRPTQQPPHPTPQPPHPTQQPQRPTPPQGAAPVSPLSRANQDLPDGVRYEPLDEETLKLFRAPPPREAPPPAPLGNTLMPAPVRLDEAAPPAVYPALAAGFERLMQDERNAHIFYRYLSTLSHRGDMEAALSNLSDTARDRVEAYGGLMTTLCGRPFTPEETEINTSLSFEEGIALAVLEENKSLRRLAAILDQVRDNETAQAIQRIINKKFINRNLLSFIKSNTQFPFTV